MSLLPRGVARNSSCRMVVSTLVGIVSIAAALGGSVLRTGATQLSAPASASSCPRAAATYSAGYNPYVLDLGDVNGDGKLDLAVANRYLSNVSVMLGNGAGGFLPPASYSVGYLPVFVKFPPWISRDPTRIAEAAPARCPPKQSLILPPLLAL